MIETVGMRSALAALSNPSWAMTACSSWRTGARDEADDDMADIGTSTVAGVVSSSVVVKVSESSS